jgi:hypothetical protein
MVELFKPLIESASYTLNIAPVIALGIFLANYAVKKGFLERLNPLIHPFARLARLRDVSALAVVTSSLSSTAAYSILAESHRRGEISERELIATTMITSFPSILSHLFTYFLPVVIPILGITTGMLYLGVRLAVSGIKSVVGVVFARHWLRGVCRLEPCVEVQNKPVGGAVEDALTASLRLTFKSMLRIASIMFATLYIVTVLKEQGVLESFTHMMQPLASLFHLQSEILLISTTEIVNKYAGLVLAADFQNNGVLDTAGVLIALLIGNVVSFSTRFVRVSIPLHVSLFGARTGSKTILLNTVFTVLLDLGFVILIMRLG